MTVFHSLKGSNATGVTPNESQQYAATDSTGTPYMPEQNTTSQQQREDADDSPASSAEKLALMSSNSDPEDNEDKEVSTSKTKKRYCGLTMEHWCYIWVAFCVIGGIAGGTIGAVLGKGTRYSHKKTG